MSILNPFYEAVAWLIVHIHDGMAPIFGGNSGASWALSIILLTLAMRLLLFPLFVKQIRNQRQMQALQPKMKELQAKYKNDKEKLNQEMMALWKEAGANPFAGCLPLIVQFPVFIALFRVLNAIKPNSAGAYKAHYGISSALVESAAKAKVFGVPISAGFSSSAHTLANLGASATTVKVLCAVLIVVMCATTFITQRQLLGRTTPGAENQMAQQQKMLLYILPLVFAVFGFRFPLGVLLYWLTTNIWSMGQQFFVIRRMDAAPAVATTPGPAGPAPGAKPVRSTPSTAPDTGGAAALLPPPKPTGPGGRPSGNRRPASRNRRKRGRR